MRKQPRESDVRDVRRYLAIVQETEPTKACKGCGERKPWSGFYKAGKGYLNSYCKDCDRERRTALNRRNPDRKRDHNRQYYERLMSDPERHALHLEQRRFAYRRRSGGTRIARDSWQGGRSPTVDAGPFAAWLSEKVAEYGSVQAVAVACEMSESRVTRVKSGTVPRVELASVDAALQAEGSTMLDELYEMEGSAT